MKVITALAVFGFMATIYIASAAPESELAVPEEASATEDPPKVECPAENGGQATIIPNPEDCTTYYVCETGTPILMYCPSGLHFNARERVCDWPEKACCDPKHDPQNKCNKAA